MEEFYDDVFNASLGSIPKLKQNPIGKDWALILPNWLSYRRGYEVLENPDTFWKRKDITFPDSIDWRYEARDPRQGSYAISLKPEVIGEVNYKKHSANQLTALGVRGNTLLEYMILALWYEWEYEDFLDKRGNLTSCIGTRLLTGEVPLGRYYMKKVEIYAFQPDNSKPRLLPREIEVISY